MQQINLIYIRNFLERTPKIHFNLNYKLLIRNDKTHKHVTQVNKEQINTKIKISKPKNRK